MMNEFISGTMLHNGRQFKRIRLAKKFSVVRVGEVSVRIIEKKNKRNAIEILLL